PARIHNVFLSKLPPPPRSPLFPYTTLFRSEGQPILLRHLVTHTAGLPRLPSRMSFDNTADPYAALTPEILLASLQDVTLAQAPGDRKSTRLNSSHVKISYAVFCLKKKKKAQ